MAEKTNVWQEGDARFADSHVDVVFYMGFSCPVSWIN